MRLFLSYAEEDEETAAAISAWLEGHGFDVYRWQDPRQRGERFIERIEKEISRAGAFLALVSPQFLTSSWCRQEHELAMQRENDLRSRSPDRVFVYVLRIAEMPYTEAGFLRNRDWFDLTGDHEQELSVLAGKLAPSSGTASARRRGAPLAQRQAAAPRPARRYLDTTNPGQQSLLFRNRRDELDKLVRGVTNAGGPHF